MRRRSDRREVEGASREEAAAERAVPEPAPAAELLALQRSAGNRAVASMLARDAKPKDKPKGEKEITGPRMIHPTIGVIPLESMQWGNAPRGGPGGQGKESGPGDIVFGSIQGPHSAALFREAGSGQAQDVEIIWPGRDGELHITLKGALITSYHFGGDSPDHEALESWSMNFLSAEFKRPGDKKGEGEEPPSRDQWDLYPGG